MIQRDFVPSTNQVLTVLVSSGLRLTTNHGLACCVKDTFFGDLTVPSFPSHQELGVVVLISTGMDPWSPLRADPASVVRCTPC